MTKNGIRIGSGDDDQIAVPRIELAQYPQNRCLGRSALIERNSRRWFRKRDETIPLFRDDHEVVNVQPESSIPRAVFVPNVQSSVTQHETNLLFVARGTNDRQAGFFNPRLTLFIQFPLRLTQPNPRFVESRPHAVVPPTHASAHLPAEHTSPTSHAVPQPPQLAGSLSVSTHLPSHAVAPPPHSAAQMP